MTPCAPRAGARAAGVGLGLRARRAGHQRALLGPAWCRQAHRRRGAATATTAAPAHSPPTAAPLQSLGFELGKPVKTVHAAELLHGAAAAVRKGKGSAARALSAVSAVFREARLGDALLLVAGAEACRPHRPPHRTAP